MLKYFLSHNYFMNVYHTPFFVFVEMLFSSSPSNKKYFMEKVKKNKN